MSDQIVPQYLFEGVNPTNEDDPFAELVAREGEFRGTPYEDSHTLVDQKKKLSLARALLGRAVQEQAARKPGPLGMLGWRYWAPDSTGQALDPGYADDSNENLRKKAAAARQMREESQQRIAGNTTNGKPITWVNRQEPERKGFVGPPAVNIEETVKPSVSQSVSNISRQGRPADNVLASRDSLQREIANGNGVYLPDEEGISPELRVTLLDRMRSVSPPNGEKTQSFGVIQNRDKDTAKKDMKPSDVLSQMERGELPKSQRLMSILTGSQMPLNRKSKAGAQRIIADPDATLLSNEPLRGRLNEMTAEWDDIRDWRNHKMTDEDQAFADGKTRFNKQGELVAESPLVLRRKELQAQSQRPRGNAAYNNQKAELLAMSDDPDERRSQMQGGQFSVSDQVPLASRVSGSRVDPTKAKETSTVRQRMEHMTGRKANYEQSGDSFGDYPDGKTLSRPDGKGNRIATSDVVVDPDGRIELKGVIGGESANRKRNESLDAAQSMRDRMSLGSLHSKIGIQDGREGKEMVDDPTPAYVKAYEIGRSQRGKKQATNGSGDGNLTPLELAVMGRGLQNAKTTAEAGNWISQFTDMNNSRQRNRLTEQQTAATREQTAASQKNALQLGRDSQQDEKQKQVTLLGQAKAQYENRLVGLGEGKPLTPEQKKFTEDKIAELTQQQDRLLSQIGPSDSGSEVNKKRTLPQSVGNKPRRSLSKAVTGDSEGSNDRDTQNRRWRASVNSQKQELDYLLEHESNGTLTESEKARLKELTDNRRGTTVSVPATAPAF